MSRFDCKGEVVYSGLFAEPLSEPRNRDHNTEHSPETWSLPVNTLLGG